MKRVDFISPEIGKVVVPYGEFETQELIKNKFWKMPLRRGFTEIEKLFNLCKKHNAYICGGYARYCASGNLNGIEPTKDVDVFCRDMESYNSIVAELNFILDKYFKGANNALRMHETKYAITYDFSRDVFRNLVQAGEDAREELSQVITEMFPIQIIKPIEISGLNTSGDIFTILKSFDLSVCQAAIISPTQILASKDFKNLERKGEMRLASIENPFMTFDRIIKYSTKKYKLKIMGLSPLLSYYEGDKSKNMSQHQSEYMQRKGQS